MEIKFEKVYYKDLLKNITCTIKENQISAIIGKSGSGKTAFLELISGLVKATGGTIKMDSTIVDPRSKEFQSLRSKIGFLFEFPEEQFFHDSVEKELGFSVEEFRYRVSEKEKRIKDALKLVGLNNSYLKKDPLSLSRGEMRKIALASILIYNPKLILLDEPTIGLNASEKKDLSKLLRMLKKKYHKTIIIVSHDIDFLHEFVDNILVINNGKIVLQGEKYEVFKEEIKLKKFGVSVPKMVHFSNLVYKKKKIKIGYRDEINDLIKDIYRYAEW